MGMTKAGTLSTHILKWPFVEKERCKYLKSEILKL